MRLHACAYAGLLLCASVFACAGQAEPHDPGYYAEFCSIVESFSAEERIASWEAFLLKYPTTSARPHIEQRMTTLRDGGTPEPCPIAR